MTTNNNTTTANKDFATMSIEELREYAEVVQAEYDADEISGAMGRAVVRGAWARLEEAEAKAEAEAEAKAEEAREASEWEFDTAGAVITTAGWEWADFCEVTKTFGDKIVSICPHWIGKGFSEQAFTAIVFDATSAIDEDGFQTEIERFDVTTTATNCNGQWNDVVAQVEARFA